MSAVRAIRALSPSTRSSSRLSTNSSKNFLSVTPTSHKKSASFQIGELPKNLKTQLKFSGNNLFNCSNGSGEGKTNISIHITPSKSPKLDDSIKDFSDSTVQDSRFFSPSVLRDYVPDENTIPHGFCSLSNKLLYTPEKNRSFLGRGTFGSVTLCRYKNHKFALKIIKESKICEIGETNFLKIRHPHLVRILKITPALDKIFIFMEYAGRLNLQKLLDNKYLDLHSRLSFAQQIVAGLTCCHEHGIIHGDIKPANVIVSPTGHCKLGDFGLSVKSAFQMKGPRPYLRGTAAYASPEVLQSKEYSVASDVYSFGILLWQLHTRETPYVDYHPHVIIYKVVKQEKRPVFPQAKTELETQYASLALSCWKQDPGDRPTSKNVFKILKILFEQVE